MNSTLSYPTQLVSDAKVQDLLLAKSKLKIDHSTLVIKFPSEERWLLGEEYAFLLRHFQAYSALYR